MSPELLRRLTGSDLDVMLSLPVERLDGCNSRARRWRASGCCGVWSLSLGALLRLLEFGA